jgi:hypothetical protein
VKYEPLPQTSTHDIDYSPEDVSDAGVATLDPESVAVEFRPFETWFTIEGPALTEELAGDASKGLDDAFELLAGSKVVSSLPGGPPEFAWEEA